MDFGFLNIADLGGILYIAVIGVAILSFIFMRFAYIQFLLNKRKKVSTEIGCKIENILTEETYRKTKKFFDSYLEVPVIIIIVAILFVIPLLVPFYIPFEVILILFLVVMVLYFAFFPQIFQAIEKRNLVKLDQYLINQNEELVATVEIFNYVWEITDDDIAKNFSVSPIALFTIFSQKIDKLFLSNKTSILLIYFDNFLDFIDNRSKIILTDKEIYSKFLEWHFMAWEIKYKYSWTDNNNLNFREDHEELLTTIEFIIRKKENYFLIGANGKSLFLFKIFKEHLQKHKNDFFDFADQGISYYNELIFFNFLKELFTTVTTVSSLPAQEKEIIWEHYFSKDWKVTIDNLKNSSNLLTIISLNYFLEWAQEKILEDEKISLDKELDTISKYLFPDIDSITWDRILIFIFSPFDGKSKVRSAIERTWHFGFTKEEYLNYYKGEKEENFLEISNKKIDKSIELALFLFKDYFTGDKLRLYIKDLEKLKYKDFSPEENKRSILLTIFNRMLNFTSQTKKTDLEPKTSSLSDIPTDIPTKENVLFSFQEKENLTSPVKRIKAIKDSQKKSLKKLLTKTQREEILDILKNEKPKDYDYNSDYWTASILGDFIKQRYNVQYKSKTSLYLIFKQTKFAYRKPGKVYHLKDEKEVGEWQKTNKPLLEEAFKQKNTVVLTEDEIILSTQTTIQKIWLPQKEDFKEASKEDSKIEISHKKENRCVYGFLNIKTGQEHTFKTQKQNIFITTEILKKVREIYPKEKLLIFWDMASWHRGPKIQEFIKKDQNIKTIYFPKYTSDLILINPQEYVWKNGRGQIIYNEFIKNIDLATDKFINYLNETNFNYSLLEFNSKFNLKKLK